MVELYYYEGPDSICSNRVIMTLGEKNIQDWAPRKIDLIKREQFTEDYLKLNPKAQVPTLVHDGNVIRESSLVCDYIDDIKPDPKLKPDNPAQRAHMREWIKDCDEAGYQATAAINFVTKFRLEVPLEVMQERWKNVTDIDRLHRQKSCVLEGFDSPYVIRGIGFWDRMMGKLDHTLSDGREWVMGDKLSLVETNYAPFIKVLDILNILELWLEDRPFAKEWWQRVSGRASYQAPEISSETVDKGETPHARAGAAAAGKIQELLVEYRKSFS